MRALLTPVAAALVALIIGLAPDGRADTVTTQDLRARCAENLKEEFGAAEFRLQAMRRSQYMAMAFGRLEMTDGSTREVRCRIYNGRRLDVSFRTRGSGADAWTKDRPSNAGYIETDEEKAARLEQEAAAKEEEAQENDAQAADQAKDAADGTSDDAEAEDQASEEGDATAEKDDRSRPRFMKVKTN
ncbi:MAG: hypothetical protein AAGB15_12250 [Pseudomonadota bacterium]